MSEESGVNDRSNQYFVEVSEVHDSVVAMGDVERVVARCPQCKSKLLNRERPEGDISIEYGCDNCGFQSPLFGWDWRHQAGFARHWISIWGVYEGEAVPGEKLLNTLQKVTGLVWNYAWVGK